MDEWSVMGAAFKKWIKKLANHVHLIHASIVFLQTHVVCLLAHDAHATARMK